MNKSLKRIAKPSIQPKKQASAQNSLHKAEAEVNLWLEYKINAENFPTDSKI